MFLFLIVYADYNEIIKPHPIQTWKVIHVNPARTLRNEWHIFLIFCFLNGKKGKAENLKQSRHNWYLIMSLTDRPFHVGLLVLLLSISWTRQSTCENDEYPSLWWLSSAHDCKNETEYLFVRSVQFPHPPVQLCASLPRHPASAYFHPKQRLKKRPSFFCLNPDFAVELSSQT